MACACPILRAIENQVARLCLDKKTKLGQEAIVTCVKAALPWTHNTLVIPTRTVLTERAILPRLT